MSKMAKANVLACVMLITQGLLVLIIGGFYDEITNMAPILTSITGLIVTNQLISVMLPTVLFIFFFCRRERVIPSELIRLSPVSGSNILLIVAMSFFIQPLMGILSFVSQLVFSNNVADATLNLADEISYLPLVATIGLLPAVMEELALRGAILGAYSMELDEKRAILINGLIFGIIHLDGQQLLYAIALGAFFSYIVLRTGSIFAGMIAHFTINATQATLVYAMLNLLELYGIDPYGSVTEAEMQAVSESVEASAAMTIMLSLVIFIGLLFASYRIFFVLLAVFSKRNPQKSYVGFDEEDICSFAREQANVSENAVLPEIESFMSALIERRQLSKSFFITFSLLLLIYMAFMAQSGIVETLFLLCVFVSFFFVLFFFRIRS